METSKPTSLKQLAKLPLALSRKFAPKLVSPLPPEAVEFLSPAEAIDLAPTPWLARRTVHFMGVALIIAVIWANVAQMEEIIYAPGKLANIERTLLVQPLETGIIRSINVREGEHVKRGQVLVTLDSTFAGADLAQSEERVRSLTSQQRRLTAELEGKEFKSMGVSDPEQLALYQERQQYHAARLRSLDETVMHIRAQVETTRRSAALLSERLKTANEIEDMQSALYHDQVGSRLKLLGSHDQRLGLEQELSQANNHLLELQRSLSVSEADRDTFIRDWRQKLGEDQVSVNRELNQLRETIEKAKLRHDLSVLTAPADGVVLEVAKRSISSIVREAEPLVTIAPLDAPLEVEARVDAASVGRLHVGSQARVKVDTFIYQKYGDLPATVTVISQDSFKGEAGTDLAKDNVGHNSVGTYFLARLKLDSNRLPRQPKDTALTPGMTVMAEIVVGKRSLMAYLFQPVDDALRGAMHEP